MILSASCRSLISEGHIGAPIELRLIAVRGIILVSWTASALDSFAFLGRVVGAHAKVGWVVARIQPMLISEVSFVYLTCFGPVIARAVGDTLALGLRLANSKLFCDKAIFDYLVYIFFLGKGTFIIEIEIAHLLANIGLVHALGVTHVSVVSHTLTDEASIHAISVGCSGALLMSARLDLILAK